MEANFDISFVKSGRGKAQCAPDPNYPEGVNATAITALGRPSCTIMFPYPAPECGHFVARCRRCSFSVAVTAAGRPDDPRSLTVTCARRPEEN